MYYIKSPSVANAYEKAIELILEKGVDITTENNQKCRELLNVSIEITNPNLKRISSKYSFDKQFISKYTDDLINGSDNNFVYSYNERIFKYPNQFRTSKINQLDYVIKKLNNENNTRRAVISLFNPFHDTKEEHIPCLNHIQFQKYNNNLYMTTLFRSNDIGIAFHSNALALIKLGEMVAEKTNCNLRNYIHHINNAHIYIYRDKDILKHHFNFE